jgi:transposase
MIKLYNMRQNIVEQLIKDIKYREVAGDTSISESPISGKFISSDEYLSLFNWFLEFRQEYNVILNELRVIREEYKKLSNLQMLLTHKYNILLSSNINLIKENNDLKARISYLEEQNAHLQHKIYGASSEKLESIIKNSVVNLIDEEDSEDKTENQEEDFDYEREEEEKEKAYSGKKRGRRKPPANLARKKINHDLLKEDKVCAQCSCLLCHIGQETSYQYQYIPARVVVIEHIRHKYSCKNCGSGVKIAAAPPRPMPKCMADPGLLSYILISKYQYHIPLYRQSKMFSNLGVDFSRSTLCDWVLGCAAIFTGLYEALQKDVVSRSYLCTDETTVQVLKEPNKKAQSKSFMWVVMSGDKERRGIFFKYDPTRKSKVITDILGDYQGYLQTDGYSGYNEVRKNNGLLDIGCWGHARRDFCDVLKLTKNKSGKSRDALHLISKLYKIEDQADELNLSFEDRRLLREEKARPIIEKEIVPFMVELKRKAPPKHKLGKGASYILNNIDALKAYLSDGRIRIDNVIVENAIRPLAQGRRNWLFMNSVEGAIATAIMYSLIETCKYNDINAELYIVYLLKTLPRIPEDTDLSKLLPYNIDVSILDKVYEEAATAEAEAEESEISETLRQDTG